MSNPRIILKKDINVLKMIHNIDTTTKAHTKVTLEMDIDGMLQTPVKNYIWHLTWTSMIILDIRASILILLPIHRHQEFITRLACKVIKAQVDGLGKCLAPEEHLNIYRVYLSIIV